LPTPLAALADLAHNLRWAWNYDALDLFQRLDPDLWERTNHNPIAVLNDIAEEKLQAVAGDAEYVAAVERAAADLEAYLHDESWFDRTGVAKDRPQVAYFSMEFGLHESLPIYSGGLGVLAGDHLKSASDLGVPLIAVGLLYQEGYFQQQLDHSGWQQDLDENNVPDHLPIALVNGADGAPVKVRVQLLDRETAIQCWQVRVGRVQLYLLDTNLPENHEEDQRITSRLYGGEIGVRIRQEIVLGIGGYRLLEALGITPPVYHMNEGHAAFLTLEHIRRTMERQSISFAEARELVRPGLVFTTHTPVAAGHDYFSPHLMEQHLSAYVQQLGMPMHELIGLGRHNPDDYREYFCMTILALRMAARSNGVSRLHGEVSRNQWRDLWPGVAEPEIPIGHITNGVHLPSFISREMADFYERQLGLRPGTAPSDPAAWRAILQASDSELWAIRTRLRARLLDFIRERSKQQAERLGQPDIADEFDPNALTIGFARRFATYKRATLLLRDMPRLEQIVNDAKRPVQFVFAGKAHPRDDGGKLLIQRLSTLSHDAPFDRRVVFLEGYDIGVARLLVQGVDVWLNTPQRPYEASGTSGMKAAGNGVLMCSTLDGWWVEAWDEAQAKGEEIGWSIGQGETFDNAEHQAHIDAQALYALLEREIVPAFYERGLDGVPYGWTARMKRSIASISPYFNTERMVREYTERFYIPGIAGMATQGATAEETE
jgi:starch phosphorylase